MSAASQPKAPGRIITFYSYKGGTGRSMALANVGWLLASAGKQVLLVDWDLEAPGLHRYIHPFLADKNLTSSDGVIDFVIRIAEKAAARTQAAQDVEASLGIQAPRLVEDGSAIEAPRPAVESARSAQAAGYPESAAGTSTAASLDRITPDQPAARDGGGDDEVSTAPTAPAEEEWYVSHSNMLRYAVPLEYDFPGEGTLDFIPAGRQGPSYAVRVNSFNWQHFYDRLSGYAVIEEAKKRMKEEYDYILIDSRTGVSDTAGICTVQFPDDLVICFTLNTQSIDGASAVAASVRDQRKLAIRIFPVPMRVEDAESDRRDARKDYAKGRFSGFPDATADEAARQKYWGESNVRYIAFYAYEEVLACFRDNPTETDTMLQAMRRITTLITGVDVTGLPVLDETERLRQLARFAAAGQEQLAAPSPAAAPQFVYWSANDRDRDAIESLSRFLGANKERVDRSVVGRDTRWLDGLRTTLRQCRCFVLFLGPNGLNEWQRSELALAADHMVKEAAAGRTFSMVTVLLPGVPERGLPLLVAQYPAIEFRDTADEKALAALMHAGEVTAGASRFCPYAGLRAYREEDGGVFFGRELLVDELCDRVRRLPLIVVTGPSGIGKTSLVQAGLLPRLRLPDASAATWTILTCSITDRPFETLAAALVRALQPDLPDETRAADSTRLAAALAGKPADAWTALKSAITSILQRPPLTDRLLLVLDLGEVPSQTGLPAVGSLLELLTGPPPDTPLTLVVVASSDAAPHRYLVNELLDVKSADVRVDVPPPTSGDLRRIIESPARAAGLMLEPGLADRILGDVDNTAFRFPSLALTLVRLWEQRRSDVLTLAAYSEIGGVSGAFGSWAESKFAALTPDQQEAGLRLLSRLVTPSGARRCLPQEGLDAALKAAADPLMSLGLVVQQRDEMTGVMQIGLVHDALISSWSRLRATMQNDRQFLAWRQQIDLTSSSWSASKLSHALLRDQGLAEAQRWLESRPDDLTELEKRFIVESAREEEANRRRAQTTVAHARRTRRLTWVGVALGFVALILAAAVFFARDKSYGDLVTQGSVAALTSAIQSRPNDARAYQLRAALFAAQGQIDRATADYEKAAELNPAQALSFFEISGSLHKSAGQLEQAVGDYNRILALSPNRVQTLKDRAAANREMGNLDTAIADYDQILKLAPTDSQSFQDRAYALRLRAATDLAMATCAPAGTSKRAPVVIQSYDSQLTPAERTKLATSWKTLGFCVDSRDWGIPQKPNSVWYDPSVQAADWKSAAGVLLDAGITLRQIRPRGFGNPVIQVGYSGTAAKDPPITRDQLQSGFTSQ